MTEIATLPLRAAEAARRGLYDPRTEHDACGIGLLADIEGRRSHRLLRDALTALARLEHRGGVGSDPLTGDGAGVLLQIPHNLLAEELGRRGVSLPGIGAYGLGMLFLPTDPAARSRVRGALQRELASAGLDVVAWRDVPVDRSVPGPAAQEGMPHIAQVFVTLNGDPRSEAELARRLYAACRALEQADLDDPFYICSRSTRTVVYKGLLLPDKLAAFYPDLADPRCETAIAVVHQRFSTNTFPTWERAHPNRLIAHNGEINTLRGNAAWMHHRARAGLGGALSVDRVCDPTGSDSAHLDNALELLVHGGRTLPHALAMALPPAWENDETLPDPVRAFHAFHASLMEPWDGPAALAFSDGRIAGATLDRNGLRPARWLLTRDGRLILSSEVGVLDLPASEVAVRGRLKPGEMIVVDTEAGRLLRDPEIKAHLAAQRPYGEWLAQGQVPLEGLTPADAPPPLPDPERLRAQRAHGYTREDLQMLLTPMAVTGKEPIGAMGNDTPLAVLSERPQPLFHYFKQLFAQVTNPPIDPIREAVVLSLRTVLGPRGPLLEDGPDHCRQVVLDGPVLLPSRLQALRQAPQLQPMTLSTLFDADETALEPALVRLCQEAEAAVRAGAAVVVLSDRGVCAQQAAIPGLLATSAVHHHLARQGLRTRCGLVVETGEAREVMHMALLIGFGAEAVCPWLALETVRALQADGELAFHAASKGGHAGQAPRAGEEAVTRYVGALHRGLLKILGKMGISTLQSYHGARIFEAVGLGPELMQTWFPQTASRLGGLELPQVEAETLARHRQAWQPIQAGAELPTGGRYRWRRDGERHAYEPNLIGLLQHAVRSGDRSVFARYSQHVQAQAERGFALRGLLEPLPVGPPVPLDEVESAEDIVRRFKTGAMSFGSLSKEAHETLAVAMNRIGARSNSGEGGEDPARYAPDANGDSRRSAIKQVASGRFGVTTEYLVQADELQIKIAQGAKPGEGGQLPAHKVVGDIARVRHATEGVGLISPPPHHDIYSIEDLAQLIFDLKKANDRARVSVKLVSEVGVGTVAAGVAKAGADTILISGPSGGTGASPLSSIQHAGVPWELGLAEAQQVLAANGLRGRVRLEVDGQLKTGRDVVLGALLGAEEFGFGTAALVAAGCVLMRVCHLNTCPVGVATQDPQLRARFAGLPEHVIHFMLFVAEEVREWMAKLGYRTMEEMVGRADRLAVSERLAAHPKARHLDLSPLLHVVSGERRYAGFAERQDSPLDARLLAEAAPALRGQPVQIRLPITNADRTFGTRLASEITRRHGSEGLADDTVTVHLRGTAGQSFGAFLAPGVSLLLQGDANDAVGKGMSGGCIAVRSDPDVRQRDPEDVAIGNVALYGATGGQLFVAGAAGERFAVRNSGAVAVVEGVGDHGCEYMTGGTVLVLGPTGRNFAAGMSGGLAYVLDEDGAFAERCNRGLVDLERPDEEDLATVLALLTAHRQRTDSPVAWRVLAGWRKLRHRIVKVVPREYRDALARREAETVVQEVV